MKKKTQYKSISFSNDSDKDFRKYTQFLIKNGDEKFKQKIKGKTGDEVEEIVHSWLEDKISNWVDNDFKHKESIYPEKTEYGRGYKMLVSGEGERVIFYETYTDKKGNKYAKIHKCPHYKDFCKDLEDKNIKPKEDADASILLDLLELERQDMVRDLKKDEDGLPDDVQKEFDKRKKN